MNDITEVKSERTGEIYTVDSIDASCTCKGFRYRGYCKHLRAEMGKLAARQRLELRGRMVLIG
jgi:uncharacterized Zn finger protein